MHSHIKKKTEPDLRLQGSGRSGEKRQREQSPELLPFVPLKKRYTWGLVDPEEQREQRRKRKEEEHEAWRRRVEWREERRRRNEAIKGVEKPREAWKRKKPEEPEQEPDRPIKKRRAEKGVVQRTKE